MSPAPAATRSKRTTAPRRPRGLSSVRPPRRVSGPAAGRRPLPPQPAPRLPRPLRAAARAVARLIRHPLVDRVIGGRWSIAVIAFALIGIVTLQLGLLKLNVGVGQSLQRERTLERENATLGIENAELASPQRIRQLAARLGMSPVALTQLRFLRAKHDPGAAAGAASRLHSPAHPASEAAPAGGEAASSEGGSPEAASSEAAATEAAGSEPARSEAAGPEAASTATESADASSSAAEASSSGVEAPGGEGEAPPGTGAETGEGG